MANLKDVIYLSNEDYEVLVSTGTVTINGTTLTYDESNVYITPEELATQSSDGLMSAADKAKLDNLDTNTNLVHITGSETITGEKTIANNVNLVFGDGTRKGYIVNDTNAGIVIRDSASGGGIRFVYVDGSPAMIGYGNNENLGTSTNNFGNLYLSGTSYFGGTNVALTKDPNDNRLYININGNTKAKFGSSSTIFATSINPDSNNNYDLGSGSLYWRNLQLSGNLTDGTNSVTVANIVAKEDASNKTSTLSSTPGNTKYPTEKLLYDLLPKVIR